MRLGKAQLGPWPHHEMGIESMGSSKPRRVITRVQVRFVKSLRLCLVLGKFEGKCKSKKIKRNSKRKEKMEEDKKQI